MRLNTRIEFGGLDGFPEQDGIKTLHPLGTHARRSGASTDSLNKMGLRPRAGGGAVMP